MIAIDVGIGVPDGENTSSLSETGLLLDTADPLLEDGGDLGRGGFGFGGIAANLLGGVVPDSRGAGLRKIRQYVGLGRGSSAATPVASTKLHCNPNGIGISSKKLQMMAGWLAGAIGVELDGLTDAILP